MYILRIFVKGAPGFFQLELHTLEQAMDHFAAITSTGYRRITDRGELDWYAPSEIQRIKVKGPKLDTQYPDKFVRT